MQEFETYEVINLLRNYDNKKFELVGGTKNLSYLGIKAINSRGYLHIISKNEREILNLNEMTAILLHGKWREIKEPVDFMTAFGEWYLNDKDIACILDGTEYRFSKNRDIKFCASQISRGKWYIED